MAAETPSRRLDAPSSWLDRLVAFVLPEGFVPARDPFVLGTQLAFFLVLGRAPAGGEIENDGALEVIELARTQFLVDLYEAVTGPLIPAREWV